MKQILLFILITTVFVSFSEGRLHDNKDSVESNSNSQESRKGGRGVLGNLFGKWKAKKNQKPNVTVLVPEDDSDESLSLESAELKEMLLYKKALKNPHYAAEASKLSTCRGKPSPPTTKFLNAVVKCTKKSIDYSCYKTCILTELGLIVDGKYSHTGTTEFYNNAFKFHPERIKKGAVRSFKKCFEGEGVVMEPYPNCSDNNEIINCLKEVRRKICLAVNPQEIN